MKLLTTLLAATAICAALLGTGAYMAGPAAPVAAQISGLTAETVLGTDGIARDGAASPALDRARPHDLATGALAGSDPNG